MSRGGPGWNVKVTSEAELNLVVQELIRRGEIAKPLTNRLNMITHLPSKGSVFIVWNVYDRCGDHGWNPYPWYDTTLELEDLIGLQSPADVAVRALFR